jgi:hypothetical protein
MRLIAIPMIAFDLISKLTCSDLRRSRLANTKLSRISNKTKQKQPTLLSWRMTASTAIESPMERLIIASAAACCALPAPTMAIILTPAKKGASEKGSFTSLEQSETIEVSRSAPKRRIPKLEIPTTREPNLNMRSLEQSVRLSMARSAMVGRRDGSLARDR